MTRAGPRHCGQSSACSLGSARASNAPAEVPTLSTRALSDSRHRRTHYLPGAVRQMKWPRLLLQFIPGSHDMRPGPDTTLCLKIIAAFLANIVRAPINLFSSLGEKGDVLGAVDVSFFHFDNHP